MGVCDVPIVSTVCDKAGEAAATLVSAPFDWIAAAMGEAAKWIFESVWEVMDTTTLVDITSDEYVGVYNVLFGVAVFLMLLFFSLQLITGLIKRDPTALSRAALGLAKSVLGSFVVVALTALTLEIVDQLSIGIIQAAGDSMESMGDKIALLATGLTAINLSAPGVGAVITIFLAGLAIAAAFIVWLSLLIRKALLLVAIVLAPVAFAGSSWDATKGWISKWLAFVIALIFSKLVLTVVFLVATTQVSAPIDGDLASISDPIAGVVLMCVAGFAPYLTYKFISFVGIDVYHAVGSEQDAKSALNRPVPMPSRPQGGNGPKKVLDGGDSASGSAGDSGGKTPPAPKPQSPSGNVPADSEQAAEGSPAGPAIVGAKIAKDTATAGPKTGQALGEQAESSASGADQQPSSTPPPQPVPKPPNPPSEGAANPSSRGGRGGDRT